MQGNKPKTIKDLLLETEGAPAPEQIEAWKTQYGEVKASAFTEKEIYLFRPLTKSEHDAVGHQAAQAGAAGTQFDAERAIVETCLLWASDGGKVAFDTKAGTVGSLQEQVSMISNFHSTQMLAAMVEEL